MASLRKLSASSLLVGPEAASLAASNNRKNWPDDHVLKRLSSVNAMILPTDGDAAILLLS